MSLSELLLNELFAIPFEWQGGFDCKITVTLMVTATVLLEVNLQQMNTTDFIQLHVDIIEGISSWLEQDLWSLCVFTVSNTSLSQSFSQLFVPTIYELCERIQSQWKPIAWLDCMLWR